MSEPLLHSKSESDGHKNSHHTRPLPLLSTPLSREAFHKGDGEVEIIPLEPTKSKLGYTLTAVPSTKTALPVFNQLEKAEPIELFYDLFFVANLTSFTGKHEMNDSESLKSYIGFFALIWFTWLQVALYDVRFGKDSVLDRVCKAIQLGVMIGFFFIGFNFSPGNSDDSYVDGFTTSMVLMASRLTLTIQYGMSFFFSHHYTAARMPFILIIGTLFVTAMVYLGVAFWYPTYTVNTTDKVYIVWYVLAGLELGITVCASIRWRTLGFKGTHIVERLSLLTLIIIGEGIIGLGEAIQTATNFDISISGYDGAFYGVVVAGTLLLYFLYQLYFDNVNEEHFGTIREQIWVVMHFPLHISFILFVEGSSQAIKWFRAWSQQNIFGDSFLTNEYWQNVVEANDTTAAEQWLSANNNTGFFQEQAQFFNETLGRAFESTSSVGNVTEWIETHQQVQDLLRTIANGSTITFEEFTGATLDIYTQGMSIVFGAQGIELPPAAEAGESSNSTSAEASNDVLQAKNQAYVDIFYLVLQYFFIAGGIALIIMGILAVLCQPKTKQWKRRDYARYGSFIFWGLMPTAVVTPIVIYSDPEGYYASGPWPIPTMVLILGACILCNHLF